MVEFWSTGLALKRALVWNIALSKWDFWILGRMVFWDWHHDQMNPQLYMRLGV